jgi:molecular chaperone Hsp33
MDQVYPPGGAPDNLIQSFRLESTDLRGRSVKIGSLLEDILGPHAYPLPVAHLVAETATLALLLSSMLKFEGIFTLQTKGDGPVSLLVADVTSEGAVRACASFDPERLEHARQQLAALKPQESSQNHLAQYLGKGYIAFTVDQGAHTERYQGIVELAGASLVDCVQHYFKQSEQIVTALKLAVGRRAGVWRAGGMMVQQMPEEGGNSAFARSNTEQDDWRRTMVLLHSASEDEFLDAGLHPHELLYRLFHEETVRVYDPLPVFKACRCSAERVWNVLSSLSADDLDYMSIEGRITTTCEFCSAQYVYERSELAKGKIL